MARKRKGNGEGVPHVLQALPREGRGNSGEPLTRSRSLLQLALQRFDLFGERGILG